MEKSLPTSVCIQRSSKSLSYMSDARGSEGLVLWDARSRSGQRVGASDVASRNFELDLHVPGFVHHRKCPQNIGKSRGGGKKKPMQKKQQRSMQKKEKQSRRQKSDADGNVSKMSGYLAHKKHFGNPKLWEALILAVLGGDLLQVGPWLKAVVEQMGMLKCVLFLELD